VALPESELRVTSVFKALLLALLAILLVSSAYFIVSSPPMKCFGPNVHDCREK
jgi:hypothetical protein